MTDVAPAAVVCRLGEAEWSTLRAVRLALLAEAPYAFGTTLDEERGDDEATWRRRLAGQAWFVAMADRCPVGVAAGGQLREPDPGVRTLRSMWVTPERRGTDLAARLVDAVVAWARDEGATVLSLWATESAQRARAFYVRYGFRPAGESREMDHRPHVAMARYVLDL